MLTQEDEPCRISQRFYNLPENIAEDTCVLDLEGELDLYSSRKIQEFFDSIIQKGYQKICVDLSKVRYIDSSGLGIFLRNHTYLAKSGGYIRLIAPSKEVNVILELTKLHKLLLKFDSVEKAIKRVVF
ncbi:MAG: STAS domain-containing protein [Leptospiraceae bacterium]|nr:STAS domain-containing protein [Leptospiraceae bacterium]MCP5497895.1 STAS domain-containing protein [Leptospiraceae bacterium]